MTPKDLKLKRLEGAAKDALNKGNDDRAKQIRLTMLKELAVKRGLVK